MLIAAVTVLLAWAYLVALHGRFWLIADTQLPHATPARYPRVAVIIPARNEADVIGRAMASLLAQDYAGESHIFLVDDNSADGTAAAAGASPKLTVLKGAPLLPGRSGKVWAMQQGWQAAQRWSPEMVLLTDADIIHPPDAISRLIAQSEAGFDLVSLMVRLHCEGWAERLMIPAFVYFFFMLYPPRWIAAKSRRDAGAAGGCILVSAQKLREAAAFESLHAEIIDDCALARSVKDTRGALWLGLADEAVSIRGYEGVDGIVRMIARTAFRQLRHSFWLLLASVLGLAWLFFAPVGLLFSGNHPAEICAAVAIVLMLLTYWPITRYYRSDWWMAFTLPLAAAIFLYATVFSAIRYWSGSGGHWKGRVQDA